MCRASAATICALALSGAAAEVLSWSFDSDLQGWAPANWETVEVEGGAIQGVTKYDCQLLSPVLNIRAEDYPEMVVRVRSDLSAGGELFFNAPGERMTDETSVHHSLSGGPEFVLYRLALGRSPLWKGTIERVRFDPLNPAGAHVAVDFIALLPEAGQMLLNGGAEILEAGKPFGWACVPDEPRATVTTEHPFAGSRALRLADGGWWETDDLDFSFLGTFRVSGQLRSRGALPLGWTVDFRGVNGEDLSPARGELTGSGDTWSRFEFEFAVPRRAATGRLRFTAATGAEAADLDEVQVVQRQRGSILTPPPAAPQWQAAWIWHPLTVKEDHTRAFFRREFELPDKPVDTAQMQLTADDAYALYLNGTLLGKTFGETDGWRTPELVDLKPVLHPGRNTIAIEAEDIASAQGLIAEAIVAFADQTEFALATDSAWRTTTQPEPDWTTMASTPGTWVEPLIVGKPPCQPWGNLPCRFLGVPAEVTLILAPIPSEVRPPATVPLTVEAKVVANALHPVYLAVVLERGEQQLRREWAPRPIFGAGAAVGQAERLDDWSVPLPYGLGPGPVRVRLEAVGARLADPAPEAECVVVAPRRTGSFAKARIKVRNGLPELTVNGALVSATQVLFNRPERLHLENARAAGVRVWSVDIGDMGFRETGFDFQGVDQTLARYLEVWPEAWLLPTFTLDTREQPWWIKAHPEARCRLEDGSDVIGDYAGARRQVPSYASAAWQEAYVEATRQLLRHLRDSPFASRIIGFQPCTGISWEWFHWGSQSDELVDYSEAGQADFRRWLRGRYRTDRALQTAWRRTDVTLETASVPAGARRRGPARGIFFDPLSQQDVLDYHRYQHEVVAESVRRFAKVIKDETDGRALVGTYYGYTMHLPESPGFCQGSGHFDLQRLLDSREVDYTMAPSAYSWRDIGGTGACMTVPGSLPLHGKLFWSQADLRTHWSEQEGFGRPATVQGSIQAMRREVAMDLAMGTAVQWYDFTTGWTCGDERLTDEMGRLEQLIATRRDAVDWPLDQYLAVVVDERQMGTFDPARPPYGLELIYGQREALLRSGVLWRAYLWSDVLQQRNLLEHRAFLFLNLFRIEPEERRFLRDKIMDNGRTVAFVGPVGYSDGAGLSAASVAELLGWGVHERTEPVGLRAQFAVDLPAPWEECRGIETGIRAEFAPTAWPDPAAATVLAALTGGSTPAVLFEPRKGYSLLWSGVPRLPPEAIRALATVAALPVIARDNDAVYAGYGHVGIHARSTGTRRVVLPGTGAVRELLSGREWPAGTGEITLDLDAGKTAILRCR